MLTLEQGKYILEAKELNCAKEAFTIDEQELQFDTEKFYKYVFLDMKEKTEIIINNMIDEGDKSNNPKTSKYIYDMLVTICKDISEKLGDECFN